ncbi:hypothetical protein DPMN_156529 [Dreissena polymorpha]|uniref:Uncharacterized protein n=1 Tax=Dreissena polymorpha TaxID=45954 RepID=A0A9D4FP66_DREPO|nr:hypothetical protein DPMN_156529 [Dreissena polymorpha]
MIQLNTGDLHSVAQSSVSRAVSQTLYALSSPNVFPNVIGVIDGTRLQIEAPSIDEPMYVNRMEYHSISTQVLLFNL